MGGLPRGLGKVQQLLIGAFAKPRTSYTLEDLFYITYPEAESFERKHRVAIKRAATTICERTGWEAMRRYTRGQAYVYFDPCDLISYASARLKCQEYRYQSQDRWIRRFNPVLDEEINSKLEKGGSYYDYICEGGAWWRHTKMAQAKRDGDTAKYLHLKAENDRMLEQWLSGANAAFRKE